MVQRGRRKYLENSRMETNTTTLSDKGGEQLVGKEEIEGKNDSSNYVEVI